MTTPQTASTHPLVRVVCPHCQLAQVRVRALAGTRDTCRSCRKTFVRAQGERLARAADRQSSQESPRNR